MKLCILSDSHDNRQLLEAAATDAKARGAEAVLHCGDVVAPSTLNVLQKHGLPVHVIHGNNTGDLIMMQRLASLPNSVLRFHGQDAGLELGGRRIFMVHYPHYARAMACTGEWDVVCCGHDHQVAVDDIANMTGGHTLLVNPGTVGGVAANPTYILLDLADLAWEIFDVEPGERGKASA